MEQALVKITFRPLTKDDFPMVLRWLNEPLVNEWYWGNQQCTLEEVHRKYGPRVDGSQPTSCFVVMINGVEAGLVQCYWVADYPDYARFIQAEPGWMGVDYFIGESTLRGHGYSSPLLRTFVDEYVFRKSGAAGCISGPHPENVRSIRALQGAGFTHLRTVGEGDDAECIMILRSGDSQ